MLSFSSPKIFASTFKNKPTNTFSFTKNPHSCCFRPFSLSFPIKYRPSCRSLYTPHHKTFKNFLNIYLPHSTIRYIFYFHFFFSTAGNVNITTPFVQNYTFDSYLKKKEEKDYRIYNASILQRKGKKTC